MNLAGRFIIDGYDLYEAFNVVVQEAQGLDVLPKVKKRTEYDWPEESGVDVDTTTDLTYEAHDITLDCYVQESTYADAVKRINGVVKLLSSDGYHLLGSQLRQRLYPVLLQEVIGYKRITPASASAVYVQFTLKLRCPLPETRIGNATVEANEEVTLVIPTAKDFTVWWGDGTVNENTLTHTYTEAGTYTVLIAGTGVTSVVITGINIAEFSYPATGDITHVDVSHTSEEVWKDFNEHAQATNNPHATNVTQEFADTQITPLAAESTYTPTVWSYLVSLFTTVPKSVKEHIVKGWTVIENLNNRVKTLEKKGELIVDVTLLSNVSEVNISVDMFGNPLNLSGDFQMILDLEYITSGGAVAERNPYIQFNGITSVTYRFANACNSFWNPQGIANRNKNYVNHILSIRGGKLSSFGYATGWTGTTQLQTSSYNLNLESNVNALQSIKVFQSADFIKAGSTIKIYRL